MIFGKLFDNSYSNISIQHLKKMTHSIVPQHQSQFQSSSALGFVGNLGIEIGIIRYNCQMLVQS